MKYHSLFGFLRQQKTSKMLSVLWTGKSGQLYYHVRNMRFLPLSFYTDPGKKHFKWIPSRRKFFVISICLLTARIANGITKLVSLDMIYWETGWG